MKNRRSALTKVMVSAWKEVIQRHYNSPVYASPDINSEAALQAYFFNELRKKIAEAEDTGKMLKNTRVFVEPAIAHEKRPVTPDLVVCRNSTVIAFVELKYLPRLNYEGYEHSGFTKDKNSLHDLYQSEGEYFHNRYRGDFLAPEGERFTFSENALLVWGGVYMAEEKFRINEIVQLSEMHPVLEMLAITNHGCSAAVSAYFAGSELKLD